MDGSAGLGAAGVVAPPGVLLLVIPVVEAGVETKSVDDVVVLWTSSPLCDDLRGAGLSLSLASLRDEGGSLWMIGAVVDVVVAGAT